MKLLLTSTGITNDSIRAALDDLLPRPVQDSRAVHIPTALWALPGGTRYAQTTAEMWAAMGWQHLSVLELTALPSIDTTCWLPEVEAADAILVAGGTVGYLQYWFFRSGFAERLPSLLEKAVYVGCSAGSMVLTSGLNYDRQRFETTGVLYDDEYDETSPLGAAEPRGLGLVPFQIRPHLSATYFPGVDLGMPKMERAAAKFGGPLYAIDDQTALKVIDDQVEVVSEGQWHLFNGLETARA